MNKLVFVGRVASAPTLRQQGDVTVVTFTLIRNEYAGHDEGKDEAKERKVAVQFTAFGKRGEAISRHVRTGDQLIVEARLENNNYTDGQGVERYGFNFVAQDFEFGAPGEASRRELESRH